MNDDLGYRTCKHCEHFYARPGSDYCGNCIATHVEWAPDLGCGDVGCVRFHETPSAPPPELPPVSLYCYRVTNGEWTDKARWNLGSIIPPLRPGDEVDVLAAITFSGVGEPVCRLRPFDAKQSAEQAS